ncbi:MAG TPA: hypothetical protein VHE37_01150 [Nevskiaceae bacterium]|nr:hypothetical protein [Nevskiaceae bacterium]
MRRPTAALALAACLPCAAWAHSFGQIYNLPVPLWLYTYGAAAALLLSFVVLGWWMTAAPPEPQLRAAADPPRLLTGRVARATSVACLLLTIIAGFAGTSNPYANIGMTLFWIWFALGLAYASALLGNFYAAINPWRVLIEWIERFRPEFFSGRARASPEGSVYIALVFYAAFVGFELLGHPSPFSLSVALVVYTLCNLAGAWWLGQPAWFARGEFFGVLFALYARMAPGRGGVLRERAADFSVLLFVLFMLSSTAYDGVRETLPWSMLYWKQLAPLLTPWVGNDIVQSFPILRAIHHVWEWLTLLASPLLYLGLYLFFIELSRRCAGSARSTRELALDFAYTLLPIVLVYHLAHYFSLLVTQGPQLLRLLSDPFGRGWDVFGTARWLRTPIILPAGWVWHTQVGLIVAGHVASVYLAHVQALRIFREPRAALRSQLPMLVLMVAFTTLGLWILAQPIQSGQVVVPAAPQR